MYSRYSLTLTALLVFGGGLPYGKAETQPLPIDELRVFTDVFAKIKNDYVEQVSDKQLLESAVQGMLEGLDPHSAYLHNESYDNLKENTSGKFGGLGIEVTMENGLVKVIAPIDDTPAQKAGIRAGDLIVKLDDKTVRGMSLNDAVNIMRGSPGEPITLTIVRGGNQAPINITLVRDIIEIKSVRFDTLEPGFGYLRVSNFQTDTADALKRAIDELSAGNGGPLKGVVLDLRNNPGGVLQSAVGTADIFIDKGLIVYTKGRIKDANLKFNARPDVKLKDAHLIVLVNGGSASASEIVAGAIQDHARGVIMGSKTFGKGSVQTVLPIDNNSALKLTTAIYYTPKGRSIQLHGITPDIVVDKIKVDPAEDQADIFVKETNLMRRLENEQDQPAADEGQFDEGNDVPEEEPLYVRDYVLHEALNVLKALSIVR